MWAGTNGFNLRSSSVIFPEEGQKPDFALVQQSQIRAFRKAAAAPGRGNARVSQGLVVIPTDSASAAQREKYQRYVDECTPRTSALQGPRGMMFAADLIGTSEEIAQQLYAHGFQEVDEMAFALPFSFDHDDYVQILTDIAGKLGPTLGWAPGEGLATPEKHSWANRPSGCSNGWTKRRSLWSLLLCIVCVRAEAAGV